jgi:hypothetical protein
MTSENRKTLTREERITLARRYHADGAITQKTWRKQGKNGRELVCALAAFGPEINSADSCPADLMPQWLAELVPHIDDGIAEDQVMWFSGALIDRAARWQVLDDAAWGRVRIGLLIVIVRQAIDAASTLHQSNPPAYWTQVTSAAKQVCEALQTGVGLDAAYAAADAARAAAYVAADAARAAANAAARAAANAAADAADRAAAGQETAQTLFRLVDAELTIAENPQ